MNVFDNFRPTLNENISSAVVAEFWKNEWRCYIEMLCSETPRLIEKYLREDARRLGLLKEPIYARDPEHTFFWRSNNGIYHQGALFNNGAIYRQANPESGEVYYFLLIDEETAVAQGYPAEGWVKLRELNGITEHSPNPDLPR